jgi:hypothetical protein
LPIVFHLPGTKKHQASRVLLKRIRIQHRVRMFSRLSRRAKIIVGSL